MSEFHVFGDAVRRRFEAMSKDELYVVDDVDLWNAYLNAYPEGSNPIFRKRTEHDCSCCKNFVRNVGNVVALTDDGRYLTVWDVGVVLPSPYSEVSMRLNEIVRQLPIKGVYRTKQPSYGAESTVELLDGGATRRWNHFSAKIASKHLTSTPKEVAGRLNTSAQVTERSLRELSLEALTTVADLIKEDAIYRGAEHKRAVDDFLELKRAYDSKSTPEAKSGFAWKSASGHGSGFRNTVIGTLVEAISSGTPVEDAVRMFEAKVAPENYKRPKALVTQRMVDEAVKTIADLGLEPALERRHARLTDVSVADVLWVDGLSRPAMKGGIEGLLASSMVTGKKDILNTSGRKITVEEFLADVVPRTKSMSVVLEPRHQRNLVSLTAPSHDEYGHLFKWPGDIGWSYVGDVTDSIRERVKRAGGNVDAPLRVSLSWFNYDDLDLHAHTPNGEVYFGNKMGVLDVDMNAGSGHTREAVENLSWVKTREGHYTVFVHQFRRRERLDVGFDLEFFHDGVTESYSFADEVDGNVTCLTFDVIHGQVQNLIVSKRLTGGSHGAEFWNLKTGAAVPVKTLTLSPNHASGEGIGAMHWFFVLEGATNPDPVRGIYNEFLRPELLAHKRVFEVLGAKSKAPFALDQMSGVGFTKGRDDSVRVDVRGEGVGGQFEITF